MKDSLILMLKCGLIQSLHSANDCPHLGLSTPFYVTMKFFIWRGLNDEWVYVFLWFSLFKYILLNFLCQVFYTSLKLQEGQ